MIMANSFVQSKKARDVEFTTNPTDRPLIVQFASSKIDEFATAAQLVQPFSDGVDLNCGCPQKWAAKEGIGAVMIKKPDLICELIKDAKRRVNHDPNFTVSAKIRIHEKVE
jgi:tRNA-dihydrouridine synthase 4